MISCIKCFILNENMIIGWLIIVVIIVYSSVISPLQFPFTCSILMLAICLEKYFCRCPSVNICIHISAHWLLWPFYFSPLVFFKLESILESSDEINPKNVCCVWEMPVSHPFCRSLVLNSKPSFPYPMLFRQTIQGCK